MKKKFYIYGHVEKLGKKEYVIRKNVINELSRILELYNIDMIVMEKNQLFIDRIDRYPDPAVYRNIMLGFGIQTSIEDRFYDVINYIMSYPVLEWRTNILNRNVKYAIDLYKDHVLTKEGFSQDTLDLIEKNNYYKAICLSECIFFDNLMNKKYQINK